MTNSPLEAKAFIENHDTVYSYVYSHLPHGDFYRPIYEGTYDVTFSADGYIPKTIKDVKVKNKAVMVLDVKLIKELTGIIIEKNPVPEFKISVNRGSVTCVFTSGITGNARISLFDMSGRLIKYLNPEAGIGKQVIVWDWFDNNGKALSNGCYIIRIKCGDKIIGKRFIFSRQNR